MGVCGRPLSRLASEAFGEDLCLQIGVLGGAFGENGSVSDRIFLFSFFCLDDSRVCDFDLLFKAY